MKVLLLIFLSILGVYTLFLPSVSAQQSDSVPRHDSSHDRPVVKEKTYELKEIPINADGYGTVKPVMRHNAQWLIHHMRQLRDWENLLPPTSSPSEPPNIAKAREEIQQKYWEYYAQTVKGKKNRRERVTLPDKLEELINPAHSLNSGKKWREVFLGGLRGLEKLVMDDYERVYKTALGYFPGEGADAFSLNELRLVQADPDRKLQKTKEYIDRLKAVLDKDGSHPATVKKFWDTFLKHMAGEDVQGSIASKHLLEIQKWADKKAKEIMAQKGNALAKQDELYQAFILLGSLSGNGDDAFESLEKIGENSQTRETKRETLAKSKIKTLGGIPQDPSLADEIVRAVEDNKDAFYEHMLFLEKPKLTGKNILDRFGVYYELVNARPLKSGKNLASDVLSFLEGEYVFWFEDAARVLGLLDATNGIDAKAAEIFSLDALLLYDRLKGTDLFWRKFEALTKDTDVEQDGFSVLYSGGKKPADQDLQTIQDLRSQAEKRALQYADSHPDLAKALALVTGILDGRDQKNLIPDPGHALAVSNERYLADKALAYVQKVGKYDGKPTFSLQSVEKWNTIYDMPTVHKGRKLSDEGRREMAEEDNFILAGNTLNATKELIFELLAFLEKDDVTVEQLEEKFGHYYHYYAAPGNFLVEDSRKMPIGQLKERIGRQLLRDYAKIFREIERKIKPEFMEMLFPDFLLLADRGETFDPSTTGGRRFLNAVENHLFSEEFAGKTNGSPLAKQILPDSEQQERIKSLMKKNGYIRTNT